MEVHAKKVIVRGLKQVVLVHNLVIVILVHVNLVNAVNQQIHVTNANVILVNVVIHQNAAHVVNVIHVNVIQSAAHVVNVIHVNVKVTKFN